ncbi:MAG: hypothetical protein JNK89_03365 [Saprospiraceae bacterium]|nr:hypothetical protein [Saprospiraceae bacterium]
MLLTNKLGPGLVWKQALGPGQSANWHQRWAFRLSGAWYREGLNAEQISFEKGDSLYQFLHFDGDKRHSQLFTGFERQYSKKRWRLYYGPEMGYWHWKATAKKEFRVVDKNTAGLIEFSSSESETRNHGLRLGLFGGAQFFFSGSWSIGAELNVQTGLDFSSTRNGTNGTLGDPYENTVYTVDARPAPLIYLSWHFGSQKVANSNSPKPD